MTLTSKFVNEFFEVARLGEFADYGSVTRVGAVDEILVAPVAADFGVQNLLAVDIHQGFRVLEKTKDDFLSVFIRHRKDHTPLGNQAATAVDGVMAENLFLSDEHDTLQLLAFDPLARCQPPCELPSFVRVKRSVQDKRGAEAKSLCLLFNGL